MAKFFMQFSIDFHIGKKANLRLLGFIFMGLLLCHCGHGGNVQDPLQNKGIGKDFQSYRGHGTQSISQEDLKKYAPKKLSEEQMAPIESMLDIRTPGLGHLSPDGRRLFFSWSVTGTRQIWQLPGQGKFPIQMTGGQDQAHLEGVTPDGKKLVVSRDRNGDEYPRLYWQDTSGGPLQKIDGKDQVRTSFQFISEDGQYVYYTMNDSSPTLHSLYRFHFGSGQRTLVFKGVEGTMWVADHRSDGTLLLANATGNVSREYYVYNMKTQKLSPLLGQGESENYSVKFAKKAGQYIVRTNKFGEYQRLYLMKNGKFEGISPESPFNVGRFSIDRQRKRILYTLNRRGYTRVKGLSASTFKTIRVPFQNQSRLKAKKGQSQILHVFFGATTANGRQTLFRVNHHNKPGSSYVYNWVTGKMTQWVLPSRPELSTAHYVAPVLDYYKARDGTEIPMFVSRPAKCQKSLCPVIVKFHGGPEGQARPWFRPFHQKILDSGFVLVQPNVRGSSGYSKSWLHADNGEKRLKVITDIEDAALHIRKKWMVDGQSPKVGVMGGSYGGYATNVAMTMYADSFDAGVSIVGMSSLVSFLRNTGPYRRHLRITEYGDPDKDKEALEKLSPINFLDRLKKPLLLVHGATDPRVPAGEALQIYRAMEEKGLKGELILFSDEGHGVRKRKNRAIYMAKTIEFFKKHLQ